MQFKDVRERALDSWLTDTGRKRLNMSDSLVLECTWQNQFKAPDPNKTDHYSIFCSMGEWNTNITDILEDVRFDNLVFTDQNHRDILFRYYTRFFLVTSEILTDFQDVLSVFRNSDILAAKTSENDKSRSELEPNSPAAEIQNLFDYINNVFKHKTKNLHACNHHMNYHFVDSQMPPPPGAIIELANAQNTFKAAREKTIPPPVNVLIPSLGYAIFLILHGYNVLDAKFKSDAGKFNAFCTIYEGVSHR